MPCDEAELSSVNGSQCKSPPPVANDRLTGDHGRIIAGHKGNETGKGCWPDAFFDGLVLHERVEGRFVRVSPRTVGRHHAWHHRMETRNR